MKNGYGWGKIIPGIRDMFILNFYLTTFGYSFAAIVAIINISIY